MDRLIEAWFDGVCEPVNPGGTAAYGVLVKRGDEVLFTEGRCVGAGPSMSNNVAEYAGVCCVMDWLLLNHGDGNITIRGDSKLVIYQLLGMWRVKGGLYLPYHQKASHLLSVLRERAKVLLAWVPREENSECDKLSKAVLTRMGIALRIQPEAKP
jgi:ribonuclease HI